LARILFAMTISSMASFAVFGISIRFFASMVGPPHNVF
jgi:hypothetical protein